jgi:hypothetical protein
MLTSGDCSGVGGMEAEAGMSKIMTFICSILGRECGEKDRKLTIKSHIHDALSIFRVMLLETEVYGVHAMDDASVAIDHRGPCRGDPLSQKMDA